MVIFNGEVFREQVSRCKALHARVMQYLALWDAEVSEALQAAGESNTQRLAHRLLMLSRQTGGQRDVLYWKQRELANLLQMDSGNVARAIQALRRKGMLEPRGEHGVIKIRSFTILAEYAERKERQKPSPP